jgi:outer membrane immunogenic protein
LGVKMKRSLLAGVSLCAIALATGAHAADLGVRPAYKAPAMAPAPWSWAGFYVGANVGFASARTNIANPNDTFFFPAGSSFDSNETGVIGGLQAGYNWQFNSVVVGLEGDISAAALNRTTSPGAIAPTADTFNGNMTALGTVRGRIGWAFDRVLVYGTGGVAFANLKDQYSSPIFPFTASASSSATGWTAGGGVEYALTDHWTARAEYLHVGFQNRSATGSPFGNSYAFAFKDSLDIGRVGINYKF